MKKMYRKGIACLLALLLCGCTAEETSEKTETEQPTATVTEAAEPTAPPAGMAAEATAFPVITPAPTEVLDFPRETVCSYYDDPDSIMRYSFKSQDLNIMVDPAQLESAENPEELLYQEYLRKFTSLQKSLDRVNALYLHLYLVAGEDCNLPYLDPDMPTVSFDAIIADEEILKEWKTLVADAKLVRNDEYQYNDPAIHTYTGVVPGIRFCVENGSSLEEIFSDFGNYHYNSPVSVTSFEFSSDEMHSRYKNLLDKIFALATEKYNQAYQETANYPYLGN